MSVQFCKSTSQKNPIECHLHISAISQENIESEGQEKVE